MKKQHLLVDLSSHGFGHFAQTSMVLNALHLLEPNLQITIRGTLPEAIIRERLKMPVTYLQHSLDIGMKMNNAVEVDAAASYDYYQSFHDGYQHHVDAEIELLIKLAPDFLLVNVPYVSLSAAQTLGIPSIAMCSLNWDDIFQSFCADYPDSDKIIQQIRQAYSSAKYFLTVTPHMPMLSLPNTRSIPPVAHMGKRCVGKLRDFVGNANAKFVLVSLGGIPTSINTEKWPKFDNVYWIVGGGIKSSRNDVVAHDAIDLPFIDLLTSCDAIITKTGYGTLVEAVASQTPVICIERGNWPEEPALFDWVKREGYLQALSMRDFELGYFANQVVKALGTEWLKTPVTCNGAEVAAEIIATNLTSQL